MKLLPVLYEERKKVDILIRVKVHKLQSEEKKDKFRPRFLQNVQYYRCKAYNHIQRDYQVTKVKTQNIALIISDEKYAPSIAWCLHSTCVIHISKNVVSIS